MTIEVRQTFCQSWVRFRLPVDLDESSVMASCGGPSVATGAHPSWVGPDSGGSTEDGVGRDAGHEPPLRSARLAVQAAASATLRGSP